MALNAVVGAQIITDTGELLADHAVIIADARIAEILHADQLPTDMPRHTLPGGYLAPGYVDIHVHGGGGAGFNDGHRENLVRAGQALLQTGVTTALPTLVSAPASETAAALRLLRDLHDEPGLPYFPGAHLEGPHFVAEQAGAQSVADLRPPSTEDYQVYQDYADAIAMVALAPEVAGVVELTKELTQQGIVVAAGHSQATADDLSRCVDAGLSHIIHLWSGQSTTTRQGPWRIPGLLEGSLASTELTAEVIADGKHLPPELLTIAYRCLAGRLAAVSDGTPGVGLADGAYYQMGPGRYRVQDGVGMTLDNTSFGGSTTALPAMVPHLRKTLNLTVPEAVAMATSVPARAARLTGVGAIKPGYRADFVHLDNELTPISVAKQGLWLK